MKRVPLLMLLILAFVSFATVGYADNSPPGVETSISYELPENIDINYESQVAQVWQTIEMNTGEDRIAVYDCDLKCWPGVDNSINYNSNNIAQVNSIYDYALYRTIDSEALYIDNYHQFKYKASNQRRLSVDAHEVLSLFENSNILNRYKKLATG